MIPKLTREEIHAWWDAEWDRRAEEVRRKRAQAARNGGDSNISWTEHPECRWMRDAERLRVRPFSLGAPR